MFARRLAHTALESQWLHTGAPSSLPPAFLLPFRARISTTPSFVEPTPPISAFQPTTDASTTHTSTSHSASPSLATESAIEPPATPTPSTLATPQPAKTPSPPSLPTGPIPSSVTSLLPLLAAQRPHFATVHIHARPYLLTEGDTVRLPFRMPGVEPGDVLRLTSASTIGSRDYTLRGSPYVDGRLFECRAVVVGLESEPMRFKEKTKRRNRKVKTVKSKHRFTELTVKELRVAAEVSGDAERGEELAIKEEQAV